MNEIIYEVFIQNKDEMIDTAYAQSLLCLAYYKKHRFAEFRPPVLKCRAYYEYCLAKIDFDKNGYRECLKHLDNYFEEINSNLYEVSYADNEGVKIMAHYYKGAALFHVNDLKNARIHLKICDKAWDGNHKRAAEYLHFIDVMSESNS